MKRNAIGFGFVLVVLALFAQSCQLASGPDSPDEPETGISFGISIPLMEDTLETDSAVGARIIDPGSAYIKVSISGPDMVAYTSPFMPIRSSTSSTSYDDDDVTISNYYLSWVEGYSNYGNVYVWCELKKITVGTDRIISVSTYDASFKELCRGTSNLTVDVNQRQTSIRLIPLVTTPLTMDQTLENQLVSKGRAKYYTVTLPEASRLYAIKAWTDASDVDLLVYDEWGGWNDWMRSYQYQEGPVWEVVTVNGDYWRARKYIIGVIGRTDGVSTFRIAVEELKGDEFSGDFVMDSNIEPLADYSEVSLANSTDPTISELWPADGFGYRTGGSFQAIDLGFDFMFHGKAYNKVFVSPDGFLSFQGFRMYYDWAWYASNSWRLWYNWLYAGNFPNDVVSLYQTRLFFRPESESETASKILYKLDEITDPVTGNIRKMLILEYVDMFNKYDAINPELSNKLNGRIELIEGETYSGGGLDGDIFLRYDRSGSRMVSVGNIFIGLENDDGRITYCPWNNNSVPYQAGYEPYNWGSGNTRYSDSWTGFFNGIPLNDIRYKLRSGGMSVTLE